MQKQSHRIHIGLMTRLTKLLVRHHYVPEEPSSELGLSSEKPLIYVLRTRSTTDLINLQECCRQAGLPDPLQDFEHEGQILPRWIAVEKHRRKEPDSFPDLFQAYLKLHQEYPNLDVQVVPVSVFWGRKPDKEGHAGLFSLLQNVPTGYLDKMMAVLLHGRDSMVRFSRPISLRYMAEHHGTDASIAGKLRRVARIHFSRQRLVAAGPSLPDRQVMFRQILSDPAVDEAIQAEATKSELTPEQARQKAERYLNEIASDFSYSLVRFGDIFLTWLWNKLYKGIQVRHAEPVRQLVEEGHEVVFMPCHRSHMDYLLLSYVIYKQGMVPPHIAAGINLNFWPAGPIFRRGGGFFIRRTFKGNRLYGTVFRAYLEQLFHRGYPVEFFTEGGRSRTGRLLSPKVGMLTMTVQAMLGKQDKPITLIPVCLGYDHVMEVNTYTKELKGSGKQKENFWQVLGILKKLRNFGYGFVNFGKPIHLNKYLDRQVPHWRQAGSGHTKPEWMSEVVNRLGKDVMTSINEAAAVNSLPLCALILFASPFKAMSRDALLYQLGLYIKLLREVPYSDHFTLPEGDAPTLLEQALAMNKITITEDGLGEIIQLSPAQSAELSFYRNNILHLFALPSLLANLVQSPSPLTSDDLSQQVDQLYPLLKAELFLNEDKESLPDKCRQWLAAFEQYGLLLREDDHYLMPKNHQSVVDVRYLAAHMQPSLQRYAITLMALDDPQGLNEAALIEKGQLLTQRMASMHGITGPEYSDKRLFSTFLSSLTEQGYLSHIQAQRPELLKLIRSLLPVEQCQTIDMVAIRPLENSEVNPD